MSLHLNRQCQRANVFFPRSLWFRAPVDPTGRDAKRRATRVGRPRCCEVAYMVRFSPRQCLFFEAFRKTDIATQADRKGRTLHSSPGLPGLAWWRAIDPLDLPVGRSGRSACLSGASEPWAEAAASVAEAAFSRGADSRKPPSSSFYSIFEGRARVYI